MIKYFSAYSGGIEDVVKTFDIFSEAMQKFVIPQLPLPELERVRSIFCDTPSLLLADVRSAIFESEDTEEIHEIEFALRRVKNDLQNLAQERGITLVLGKNGAEESREVNIGKDPFECRILNILHVCVEKLAALLAYKRVQIELSRKN